MYSLRGWPPLLYFLTLFVGIIDAYASLSDESLKQISPPQRSDFNIHTGSLLSPILIPRVPGTPGSTKVLNHFVDFFQTSLPDWTITFQNSTSKTPTHGDEQIPFVNFIATRDPPGSRPGNIGRLTLVAHYDSKYKPDGFIGAIDSAAPCAMIMHAARAIDDALTKKWDSIQTDDFDADFEEQKGIQILFLDGEEAFQSWTATDSIYGARSLAEKWDQTYHPAMSVYKSYLDSIELFVLLDLLGSAEYTPIPSWQHSSHWSYVKMAQMESRLRDLKLFQSSNGDNKLWLNEKDKKETDYFRSYVMQDDHLPFIERGVQVLHLIPQRFPRVWHTMNDNGENLDVDTVQDWAMLTAAFAAEYMELDGFFDGSKGKAKAKEKVKRSGSDDGEGDGDEITSKTEL